MSKVHNNAGGIIIKNRAVLMVRERGKTFFISRGRLSQMKLLLKLFVMGCWKNVLSKLLQVISPFKAEAAGRPGEQIVMTAFIVNNFKGTLRSRSETEELEWINSVNATIISIGSIFQHEVIPRLKKQGLID